MKKILILGAGVYQVPLIKRAKERGYYVIAASNNQTDPGVKCADEFLNIDTMDKLNLLKYSESTGIDGVTTTGTDVAVPSIGFICDTLQLPGISEYTANLATNKIAMKSKFKEYNVPTPDFSVIKSNDELFKYAQNNGFPFVVKVPDSSGSRGLTIVNDFSELDNAYNKAMGVSRSGLIIVEEYINGIEYIANILIVNGKVSEAFIYNNIKTKPPVTVPIGTSCPSRLPLHIQHETVKVFNIVVKALKIKNAICNADVMLTDEGVKILEVGARIGSVSSPEVIKLYYGVNLYDVALDLALNNIPHVQKECLKPAAYHIISSPESGLLRHQSFPCELLEDPNIISIDFDYPLNTPVRKFKTGPDRIGNIVVTGETSIAAENFAAQVLRSIRIEVEKNLPVRKDKTVV